METDLTAAATAGAYRWLARWFLAPPDAALLATLDAPAAHQAFAELGVVPPPPATGGEAALESLAVQWTRLFSAPGPQQVPPYESVYRDQTFMDLPDYPEFDLQGGRLPLGRQLHGASTGAVAAAYARAELTLDPAFGTLGDHLGAELAFLALLCEREAAAAAAGGREEAQRWAAERQRFLHEHPARWVQGFAREVQARAAGSLYARLAELVAAFVADESG